MKLKNIGILVLSLFANAAYAAPTHHCGQVVGFKIEDDTSPLWVEISLTDQSMTELFMSKPTDLTLFQSAYLKGAQVCWDDFTGEPGVEVSQLGVLRNITVGTVVPTKP